MQVVETWEMLKHNRNLCVGKLPCVSKYVRHCINNRLLKTVTVNFLAICKLFGSMKGRSVNNSWSLQKCCSILEIQLIFNFCVFNIKAHENVKFKIPKFQIISSLKPGLVARSDYFMLSSQCNEFGKKVPLVKKISSYSKNSFLSNHLCQIKGEGTCPLSPIPSTGTLF